jgi:hypothetical protein
MGLEMFVARMETVTSSVITPTGLDRLLAVAFFSKVTPLTFS